VTGSNREPVRPRDAYADRDRRDDRDRGDRGDRGDRDGGDRYRDRDRMSDRNGDRYRDRERDRERDRYSGGAREDFGRKRPREDDDYDDNRSRRRY
jgi:U1 small nuclear ribonucleoprotein